MQVILDLSWIEFLSKTIQFCFSLICHQDSSILFHIDGNPLPLCPRCIGMHLGFTALLIFYTFSNVKPLQIKNRTLQVFLYLAICFAGLHWTAGRLDLLKMDSILSLITGFITGAAVSLFLYSYRYQILSTTHRIHVQKRISLIRSLVIITAGIITAFISNYSLILFVLSLSAAININSIINTLILLLKRFQLNNFISAKKLKVIK